MQTTPVTLDVKDLTRQFGRFKAIDGVTFQVARGEVVGFLGPNGAGKSTTMRILCGVDSATSGHASICGLSVATEHDAIKKRIGYMPENNPLPEDLRVIEYLRLRAKLKGVPGHRLKQRVDDCMELCELQHKARRKIIGTLSKGFKQRVGIADALLSEPDVVVMDEPTIGLDPHQVIGMRDLFNRLRGKMTVILSSHILSEIELCCDRIIIINHGRVVASGSTKDLRKEFLPELRFHILVKGGKEDFLDRISSIHSSLKLEQWTKHNDDGFNAAELTAPIESPVRGEELIASLSKDDNLQLRECRETVYSLEDIFLAATKKSWKETQDTTEEKEK